MWWLKILIGTPSCSSEASDMLWQILSKHFWKDAKSFSWVPISHCCHAIGHWIAFYTVMSTHSNDVTNICANGFCVDILEGMFWSQRTTRVWNFIARLRILRVCIEILKSSYSTTERVNTKNIRVFPFHFIITCFYCLPQQDQTETHVRMYINIKKPQYLRWIFVNCCLAG